jgi:multidrug efflux pump subunit AcrA (membrane-fusion protein)
MITLYAILGVTVLITFLVAYARIQYTQRQYAEEKAKRAEAKAALAEAEVAQTSATGAAVREVQETRKAKQITEQAQIDAHAPRSHFEDSDF